MPIMILGLVFVIGLFAFYMVSTKSSVSDDDEDDKNESNLKTEGNVVYLPKDLEKEKKKHNKK